MHCQEAACQYGIYAHFYLISQEIIESHRIPAINIINAFDIIRASSNDICVPEFNDLPKNALEKLRIDLSNWIKNHGGGWKGKDAARHIGKQFVTDLASALCAQNCKNVGTLIQCGECAKWHVLYSKLSSQDKEEFAQFLDEI
ncbi:hypothetical protein RclHR1_01410021 [Rhizophagus clarus]|uniref:Uncharacterized protein n=1 Tax=Rhizophagus clarus TaxID=94130 RepID=A0A2Z6R4E0_9GLOM|nr:hypothetical protein RclHR1_01410021 [Rhizophagus clarus]